MQNQRSEVELELVNRAFTQN